MSIKNTNSSWFAKLESGLWPLAFGDKSSWQQLGVRRHNQFLEDEVAFGLVKEKVDDERIGHCHSSFNVVDFQRLNWISDTATTTFQFAALVKIANIRIVRKSFFV